MYIQQKSIVYIGWNCDCILIVCQREMPKVEWKPLEGLTTAKYEKADFWQSCQCHKIYKIETVDLDLSIRLLELRFFMSMWNLG